MTSLAKGLLVTAALLAVLMSALPVHYEVNDDFGAIMILAGADGFEGRPAVPFISRILNRVLFGLYQLLPEFPWFGAFVYLAAIVGASVCFAILQLPMLGGLTRLLLAVGWLPLRATA